MAPNFGERLIVIISIKQRGSSGGSFDALNRIIDSVAKMQLFSDCKPRPCREIVKE